MSSGFNTDVHVGEKTFHVQTEDRGPAHLIVDTSVYQHGRVVHRRSWKYAEFVAPAGQMADALRERVETQHRAVIDDLRAGALDAEIAAAEQQAIEAGGIQVQLLNPGAWLSGAHVSLDVEVVRRADGQPQAGAQVEALIAGALEETRQPGTSDAKGRVRIQFPLPPLGKGDLALVICASSSVGKDEIRFSMRSRPKNPSASSAQ